MDSLLELFCDVDDFCQSFMPSGKSNYFRTVRSNGSASGSLSLSESDDDPDPFPSIALS